MGYALSTLTRDYGPCKYTKTSRTQNDNKKKNMVNIPLHVGPHSLFMKDLVYMDAKNSDCIYFISTSLLAKIDKKKTLDT